LNLLTTGLLIKTGTSCRREGRQVRRENKKKMKKKYGLNQVLLFD
jgi:hypothetical protein